MLDRIFDAADPYIADAIWLLVIVPILDRIRWVFKTRESRDALHSALKTGVDRITDVLVPVILANPLGYKLDQHAGRVADYVLDSVPDAIKFLLGKPWFMRLFGMKPVPPEQQRAWIEGMAAAKINEFATDFIAKLRPDELTKALQQAGTPAVNVPSFSIPQPYGTGNPAPDPSRAYAGDPPGTIGSGSADATRTR